MPQNPSIAIPGFLRSSSCILAAITRLSFTTPLSATGWHTSVTQIVNPSDGTYVVSGMNWHGAETTAYTPGGLWAQDYKFILNEIKSNGFNTIRLPTPARCESSS